MATTPNMDEPRALKRDTLSGVVEDLAQALGEMRGTIDDLYQTLNPVLEQVQEKQADGGTEQPMSTNLVDTLTEMVKALRRENMRLRDIQRRSQI